MKALTSTELSDLLVLGNGDGGNPSKSTRTLRSTSSSSQAMEKNIHSQCKNRHAWIQLIEGDLDVNGEKLSPGDGAATDQQKGAAYCI
jgi:hypothetical protein